MYNKQEALYNKKYLFRSEKEEFEALCNPMHLRHAAASALCQQNAKFMEVVNVATGKTLMVVVFHEYNLEGFMYLYPKKESDY